MSDEWPDDDARFTGPGCRLDGHEHSVSGGAPFTNRGALKMYAVCEILQMIAHAYGSGARVVEQAGRLKIVAQFDDEGTAETAARKHAIKLADTKDEMEVKTVTVIPVWRVR